MMAIIPPTQLEIVLDLVRLRIRCAKCNKPVDSVRVEDDFCLRVKRIGVYCHGKTDAMELPLETALELIAGRQELGEGVAFNDKPALPALMPT